MITTDPHRHRQGGLDPDPPDPGAVAKGWPPHIIVTASFVFLLVLGLRDDSPMLAASGGLLISAAWLAQLLQRRVPAHRPVWVALEFLVGMVLLRLALKATLLHGGPYYGAARAAFHVEQASRVATAMVPAWLAWTTLRPPGPVRSRALRYFVALPWALFVVTFVGAYGNVRALPLEAREMFSRKIYLAGECAGLFVALLAVGAWGNRVVPLLLERRALRKRLAAGWDDIASSSLAEVEEELRAIPRITIICTLALVAAPLALLLVGAWRYGLWGPAYAVQQAGLLALYGVLAGAQAWALWRTR